MGVKTSSQDLAEMDLKNFVPDYATEALPGVQIMPWVPIFDQAYQNLIQQAIPMLQSK